jgi:ferredoxin
MSDEAIRETFGLMPPGTSHYLYLVFAPFAAAFAYGTYLRLARSGLIDLIKGGSGGIAGAAGRLGRYVFLQRRVAARPRGYAHLGIFYGFLALFAGTTIVFIDWDILRPLGVRILVGNPYLLLEAFLDALGIAFVAGLGVALVWRLAKLRASSPDQRAIQYQFLGLIAGLLYLGVTGFLLEGLRIQLRPADWTDVSFAGTAVARALAVAVPDAAAQGVYVGLWWSHAVVAFTLIALLPFTVFLHAGAAPLNVMAQPGLPRKELDAPFDLREVMESGNFDLQPGVATVAGFDAGRRFALLACTNCGRCDEVCPAVAMETALSPRRLVQSLRRQVLDGKSEENLLDAGVVSPDALWACTTCAACVMACPVLIRPVDYIVPMRREEVSRQHLDARQGGLLANLGRSANPFGLPPDRRDDLVRTLGEGEGVLR